MGINNKKSFTLYLDQKGLFNKLPDKMAGKLIKHIFSYVNRENTEIKDMIVDIAFESIKQEINRESERYDKKRGKNHWNWKGGVSTENQRQRNSVEYKEWRIGVFTRDNYKCQHCDKVGGHLNAHHIKHWATHKNLRFEVNNGLTLCRACHIKVHSKGGCDE